MTWLSIAFGGDDANKLRRSSWTERLASLFTSFEDRHWTDAGLIPTAEIRLDTRIAMATRPCHCTDGSRRVVAGADNGRTRANPGLGSGAFVMTGTDAVGGHQPRAGESHQEQRGPHPRIGAPIACRDRSRTGDTQSNGVAAGVSGSFTIQRGHALPGCRTIDVFPDVRVLNGQSPFDLAPTGVFCARSSTRDADHRTGLAKLDVAAAAPG